MEEKQKQIFKSPEISVKSVDESKREIIAIASKEVIDRDNDLIRVGSTPKEGIDITQYKKNPVVLLGHNYGELPIARAEKIWKEDKKLMIKMKFPEAEVSTLGDSVYKLIKEKYLNTLSIGFRPDWKTTVFDEKQGGYVFEKSELLEVSVVGVPSNTAAMIQTRSMEKAFTDEIISKDELEGLLKLLVTEDDPEKDLEDVIEDVKDELEKDATLPDETPNKIMIDKIKELEDRISELEGNIEKEEDNSEPLFDWLFKEHQTDKSQDGSHDKQTANQLLNSIIHED